MAWDRLADVLSEDPVITVPEFEGEFQMDIRSHLLQRLVLDESYESHLIQLCKRYVPVDRDAIDVGANAGLFSVLLATLAPERRVLAVEPSTAMIARLRSNISRNGVDGRVEVFEGALAEAEGTAQLQGIDGLEEYGTLGTLAHPALQSHTTTRSETVETISLDSLVAKHGLSPGFIKVDVEGAEARVLNGAQETLRRHRPVLLTELDDTLLKANGSSALEVFELLDRANYDLFDPMTPDLAPISRSDHLRLSEALCLPRESRE
ncbi:MAG: FkbM family methyltransferase [Rubricoccaceae bacterium]